MRLFIFSFLIFFCYNILSAKETERDLCWFLQRLRTLDHLPELENSHTALSSTWDRSGNNFDGIDYKDVRPATAIEQGRNVLLDKKGPGCIHRIFTGMVREHHSTTRIQIFLDHQQTPVIDMPMTDFFADGNGLIPYPLVCRRSYPGTMMPIPFNKHCLVQLVNEKFGTPEWEFDSWGGLWGNFWQVSYTIYPQSVKVKSLTIPFSDQEKAELDATCKAWLHAESKPPAEPKNWSVEKSVMLLANEEIRIPLQGSGIIRQMRLSVEPATPEVLGNLFLQITWDGKEKPGVALPAGRFFGNMHGGYGKTLKTRALTLRPQDGPVEYSTLFNSLFMGVTGTESYCCFPMPFAKGAEIVLINKGKEPIKNLRFKLDVEKRGYIPDNWGRFRTTFVSTNAAAETSPRVGPQLIPVQEVIKHEGRGKYVGVMLSIDWPTDENPPNDWFGEGDWIIWTDQAFDTWPPDYHGTGSEEYFNSAWNRFDRRAVSGFVCERPGHPTVYSFHLNDAFQFQKNIRVVEEYVGMGDGDRYIREENPLWTTVAYWYEE